MTLLSINHIRHSDAVSLSRNNVNIIQILFPDNETNRLAMITLRGLEIYNISIIPPLVRSVERERGQPKGNERNLSSHRLGHPLILARKIILSPADLSQSILILISNKSLPSSKTCQKTSTFNIYCN